MSRDRNARQTAAAWLAPSGAGVALFFVAPLLAVAWLAAHDWDLLNPPVWSGTDNLAVLGPLRTWRAVLTTVCIGAIALAIQISAGFLLGQALARRFPARRLLAVALLVPWAIAPLAVGAVARWILEPSDGLASRLIGGRFDALDDPVAAVFLVAAAVAWESTGLVALIYAGALGAVPRDIHDAAAMDGLGWWGTSWRIDWPLLRPTTAVVAIGATVQAFALYDLVVAMTGGGPARSTETLSMRIVDTAWRSFDVGQAAALAVAAAVIEGIVIALVLTWSRRRSE